MSCIPERYEHNGPPPLPRVVYLSSHMQAWLPAPIFALNSVSVFTFPLPNHQWPKPEAKQLAQTTFVSSAKVVSVESASPLAFLWVLCWTGETYRLCSRAERHTDYIRWLWKQLHGAYM